MPISDRMPNINQKYNLPDVINHTKYQRKKIIEKSLKEHNRINLLTKIKKYKKLDYEKLLKEEYGAKDYLSVLNIADARLKFALRTCMTRSVQANFKNDPAYKSNDWKCQVLDTQEHIVRCPVYSSIRSGKDLSKDKDIVEYFRKVIDIRSIDN